MGSQDSRSEAVDFTTDIFHEPRQITVSDTYNPNVDVVLFNGDCNDLLKNIPSNSVDLIITSPPYNIGKKYEKKTSFRETHSQANRERTYCTVAFRMEIDRERGTIVIIAAEYSFNDGDSIQQTHPYLLKEIEDIIASVDAAHHKIKESKEITMPGKMLYSPANLNRAFAQSFGSRGWQKKRVTCNYSTDYYCILSIDV